MIATPPIAQEIRSAPVAQLAQQIKERFVRPFRTRTIAYPLFGWQKIARPPAAISERRNRPAVQDAVRPHGDR
jgi:hypothetical protein